MDIMHYCSGISRISFFVNLILLCVFGNTTSGLECGGHITAWSGKITSPNYPGPYPNDLDCVWVLKPPNDLSFTIEVTDFELEPESDCEYDYLKIRFVNSISSLLENTYCGTKETPFVIRAPVSSVRLEFRTDDGVRHKGFEIKFYISTDACPYNRPVLCRNNWCNPTKFICDGDNDCADHSDEEYCDGRFRTPSIEFIGNVTEPDGTQTTDYKTETITYMNEMTEIGTVEHETDTTKYETETTEFESANTEIETLTYVTITDKTLPFVITKPTQRTTELHTGEERTRRVEGSSEIYSTVGIISGVTLAFVIGISMVGFCIYKRCQRKNTITSLENPVYQACAENVVINRT